jgi:hypothetical protein
MIVHCPGCGIQITKDRTDGDLTSRDNCNNIFILCKCGIEGILSFVTLDERKIITIQAINKGEKK